MKYRGLIRLLIEAMTGKFYLRTSRIQRRMTRRDLLSTLRLEIDGHPAIL